jgi:hypothetical protein
MHKFNELNTMQYYSKVFDIITTKEYVQQYDLNGKYTGDKTMYTVSVYSHAKNAVVDMEEVEGIDKARMTFSVIKTKHIFDYDNLHTQASPKESGEGGATNTKAVCRCIHRGGSEDGKNGCIHPHCTRPKRKPCTHPGSDE